eukprot:scaffold34354_cov148-Skeletonema_menzelii.AAC.1
MATNNNSPRTDGDDTVTNELERCDDDGNVDALGEQLGEMEMELLLGETESATNDTSLSTLHDTVLLHIFSFILAKDKVYSPQDDPSAGTFRRQFGGVVSVGEYCREQLKLQLALEKTCSRFSAFLGKDSTMRLLYQHTEEHLEFDYQVETMREKLFIANGVRMVRQYQKMSDNQISKYIGGADGVRRLIDKILTKMVQPCDPEVAYSPSHTSADIHRPPSFPPNGFKLFLRGDSIAYLTEVVEQHMVYRLNNAWTAALFRSNPKKIHPYPTLCGNDIMFVDSIRSSDFGTFHSCTICSGSGRHSCSRLSFDVSPKIWQWPDDNCLEEDIIGSKQRQHMVLAITSRAGIVKLNGALFDSIAAEILHFMATIVIDAFEVSKSLWFPSINIGVSRDLSGGVTMALIDDEIIGEERRAMRVLGKREKQSYLESDYIANHPPPLKLDEDGKHVCVIIPRQIKDAAVRIGMKPLLDSQSWEVSEGQTKKEEVNEALSLYGLFSLDDDSSSEVGSDGESVWQPSSADEADSDDDSEELSTADEAESESDSDLEL